MSSNISILACSSPVGRLILGGRPSPEFRRKVGLRTRLGYRDRIVLAFVDTFDQNLEAFGAEYG